MKKLLTLILTLTLAITASLGLTACGKDKVVDVTPNEIVVGYTDYAPMNYKENGELKGFDTELAVRVFNALGYDVKFKLIDWSNKYVELNNDTIGCVWNGFTANSKEDDGTNRSDLVDFSLYYMENGQCLFTKNANKITSLNDLANKSLAYETDSAADTLINGENSAFNGININKQGLTAQMDACEAVRNGNKDYAVIDIILAKDLIKNNSGYSDFAICDIDLGIEYYAIAFKKGSELTAKVNTILKAFKETGYIDELAEKYGVATAITDFTLND